MCRNKINMPYFENMAFQVDEVLCACFGVIFKRGWKVITTGIFKVHFFNCGLVIPIAVCTYFYLTSTYLYSMHQKLVNTLLPLHEMKRKTKRN